jgi:riboflavin kinase/FMN adenylyltransferase
MSAVLERDATELLRTRFADAARPCIAVIGTFDGVHHGHRALLRSARRVAAARGLAVIAVTMDPRPDRLKSGDGALPDVCSLQERIRRLHWAGADDVVVVPFTVGTAALSCADFCALLTEELGVRAIYVGEDFALGRGREGTPARMRELGLDVHTLALVPSAGTTGKASSTNVRNAIARGVDPRRALAAA